MRNTVIKEIEALAAKDERIAVITGDLGYNVLDHFMEHFPQRFFNVGIAEQVMTSAAAGMALSGNVVFTYSIGNFATLRCIEQIRNDVCYHNANVKIIAVGGGFSYGQLGMSHHATEDIAMMRVLPNMRVFVPADPEEAANAVRCAVTEEGPCYIRLAHGHDPILYSKPDGFCVNQIQTVFTGKEVALLACGPLLREVIEAAKCLNEKGISASVYSVPCVKPLEFAKIQQIAMNRHLIVTVEEHQVAGGLGGAVAEVLSGLPSSGTRLCRLGLKDEYTSIVGSHEYLCDYYGVSCMKIADFVCDALR